MFGFLSGQETATANCFQMERALLGIATEALEGWEDPGVANCGKALSPQGWMGSVTKRPLRLKYPPTLQTPRSPKPPAGLVRLSRGCQVPVATTAAAALGPCHLSKSPGAGTTAPAQVPSTCGRDSVSLLPVVQPVAYTSHGESSRKGFRECGLQTPSPCGTEGRGRATSQRIMSTERTPAGRVPERRLRRWSH